MFHRACCQVGRLKQDTSRHPPRVPPLGDESILVWRDFDFTNPSNKNPTDSLPREIGGAIFVSAESNYFLTFPLVRVNADALLFPFLLAQISAHHASTAGRENRSILPPSLTNGIGW
jgi:hypothetical protein